MSACTRKVLFSTTSSAFASSLMVTCLWIAAPSAQAQIPRPGSVAADSIAADTYSTPRSFLMPGWGMMGRPIDGMGGEFGSWGRPGGHWDMMRGASPDGWMGHGGALTPLALTEEQAQRIAAIHEEVRQKTWTLQGQWHAERFRLLQLHHAEPMDVSAVAEQQRKVDALKGQLQRAHLESRAQIEGVLTPEQRRTFRRIHSRWLLDD